MSWHTPSANHIGGIIWFGSKCILGGAFFELMTRMNIWILYQGKIAHFLQNGLQVNAHWRLSGYQSTIIEVMAWYRQAISLYLNQCWPSSMTPYVVIMPQCVRPRRVCPNCPQERPQVGRFTFTVKYEYTNALYAMPQYGRRVIQEPLTGANCC